MGKNLSYKGRGRLPHLVKGQIQEVQLGKKETALILYSRGTNRKVELGKGELTFLRDKSRRSRLGRESTLLRDKSRRFRMGIWRAPHLIEGKLKEGDQDGKGRAPDLVEGKNPGGPGWKGRAPHLVELQIQKVQVGKGEHLTLLKEKIQVVQVGRESNLSC
jgi:hypothetical protein